MAGSQLFPLAIAGVVIVGAAAWLLSDLTGDDTPVAAQPEGESDHIEMPSGVEAGSFQDQPEPAQPEAQTTGDSESATESSPGTVEAVPGSAMLGVAPPPAPPVNPVPAQTPTTQREDAIARSIDSATEAWSTRLNLDSIQKVGLRDAFEANALRQEELRNALAEGRSKSDLLAMRQENQEALVGDLQSVLTTTQLAEYERIIASPDGE